VTLAATRRSPAILSRSTAPQQGIVDDAAKPSRHRDRDRVTASLVANRRQTVVRRWRELEAALAAEMDNG
jgi:hypothetical protein